MLEAAMGKVDEYLRNARECRAVSKLSTPPENKADFLKMAEMWERLAKEAQENAPGMPDQGLP